ncbi:methyltransferase domain-containing protein [candidate division KSB1 bacterium]|nr:methyltransferase domain-containing protein [candidate division KSB1 bacterium]
MNKSFSPWDSNRTSFVCNMTLENKPVCPMCSCSGLTTFFTMPDVPVFCNKLWPEAASARECVRGDIELAFCDQCGFITNLCFDEHLMDYNEHYDNSLHHSSVFQEYIENAASDLIKRYNLHDKNIIEIGSGQGDFIRLLCRQGDNRGIGFDPAFVARNGSDNPNGHVRFIRDFYSTRYSHIPADLFCCRFVLEHLNNPSHLLATIRASCDGRSETALYVQVPNSSFILTEVALWDIIYEHCSYFTPRSLYYMIRCAGFRVTELVEEYADQYLSAHAVFTNGKTKLKQGSNNMHYQPLKTRLDKFQSRADRIRRQWRAFLSASVEIGLNVVLWGAGSKGVTFLNQVDPERAVSCVVDVNPKKQGHYIPGTGQAIISPDDLVPEKPDIVIVANPVYMTEIKNKLQSLALNPELISL